MKTLNYCVTAALSVLLAACGGGGSSGSSSSSAATSVLYSGYAVDDYVIGGTVEFKDMASAKVLATTTTGAMGQFSASLDPGLNYLVTITGGVLDTDGDPATTSDQQANSSPLQGIITPEIVGVVQIFSAATTGITQHANGDAAKYVSSVKAVNDVFPVLVSTPSEITRHLNTVLSVQSRVGFASSVSEFSDDGALNGSGQLSAQSVKTIADSAAGAVSVNIKDPLLFGCIEEALEKQGPSLADLETLTELNCSNRAIYSLDGIQQLKNLGALVVRDNAITDVRPLAGLGKLTYLDLADNRIATINALATATFTEIPLVNVSNNCIASMPTTPNIEVIQTGTQRSTCNKVVRDSLLFNVSRQSADTILMIYRIPANTCAMEYSSILGAPLVCDNRVHRQVLNVASTGADEYVRLKVDGQTHGVYLVTPLKASSGKLVYSQTLAGSDWVPMSLTDRDLKRGFGSAGLWNVWLNLEDGDIDSMYISFDIFHQCSNFNFFLRTDESKLYPGSAGTATGLFFDGARVQSTAYNGSVWGSRQEVTPVGHYTIQFIRSFGREFTWLVFRDTVASPASSGTLDSSGTLQAAIAGTPTKPVQYISRNFEMTGDSACQITNFTIFTLKGITRF
jgi:hypothetical protein